MLLLIALSTVHAESAFDGCNSCINSIAYCLACLSYCNILVSPRADAIVTNTTRSWCAATCNNAPPNGARACKSACSSSSLVYGSERIVARVVNGGPSIHGSCANESTILDSSFSQCPTLAPTPSPTPRPPTPAPTPYIYEIQTSALKAVFAALGVPYELWPSFARLDSYCMISVMMGRTVNANSSVFCDAERTDYISWIDVSGAALNGEEQLNVYRERRIYLWSFI